MRAGTKLVRASVTPWWMVWLGVAGAFIGGALPLHAGVECDATCPPRSTVELDGCGPGPDPNGGCTQQPPAFQLVPIDLPICGTVGGYEDAGGVVARDTDWYLFTVSEPSILQVTVHQRSSSTGEPAPNFVVALLDSPNCGSQNFLTYLVGGGCPLKTDAVVVQPGEYVLFLSVESFGPGQASSACPVEYVARIQFDTMYGSCTGSANSCFNSQTSPGCADSDCCNQVCNQPGFDYCCLVVWDAYCAAEAALSDECAGDGCPRARVKSIIARSMIDRSRAKMLGPNPDLPEVHAQISSAISLSTAAKLQLAQGGAGAGCASLPVQGIAAGLGKITALMAALQGTIQFLLQNPDLSPDEVAVLVQAAVAQCESVVSGLDLVIWQLSSCPADLTNDGVVDAADLAVILGNWGGAGLGDFDINGVIDGADLSVLLGAWGNCPA